MRRTIRDWFLYLLRWAIFIVLCLSFAGCGDNEVAVDSATCGPCGNGGISCAAPLATCIDAGACATGGPGGLVLNSNGTYSQSFPDGSTTSGTYSEVSGGVLLKQTGSPVGALVGVYVGGCPLASDHR